MSIIKSIITKIANMFGLSVIQTDKSESDYSNTDYISITAAIANRLSTLTMMDSTISIKGSSERAKYLNDFVKGTLIDRLDVAVDVSLGTGDCLIKPYCDDERIGLDIVSNNNFYITETSGDFIKSVIIKCDEFKRKSDIYTRFEVHKLKKDIVDDEYVTALFIYQLAFKNNTLIDIRDVPEWANLEPEMILTGVDSMLFGRIKCPTVNRSNPNSVDGVPITYGLDSVMSNCIKAYNRFNEEYEKKEAFVFASKSLFKKDKEGNITFPQGKRRLFMLFPQAGAEENLIKEYSPEIRDTSLISGIEQNFKMLEMLCGLSSGILTAPTTNFATATEIRASLSSTFAYITKFRRVIEQGIFEVIKAVDILLNLNEITPYGEYDVSIDWSSAYIENMSEQWERLIKAKELSLVTDAEVRAWLTDSSIEEAQAMVDAIKEEGSESKDSNISTM